MCSQRQTIIYRLLPPISDNLDEVRSLIMTIIFCCILIVSDHPPKLYCKSLNVVYQHRFLLQHSYCIRISDTTLFTGDGSDENLLRRSMRTRNPDAASSRSNNLSNLISKPTQVRKKKVSAPTTGERGQALTSQKVICDYLFFYQPPSIIYPEFLACARKGEGQGNNSHC